MILAARFEKHLLQKVEKYQKKRKKKKVYAFQLECQVFQVNSITICLHRRLLFSTVTGSGFPSHWVFFFSCA